MVSIEEQLKYIYNLKYYYIDSLKTYNMYNYKIIYSLLLYDDCINLKILPNTLIKLIIWYCDNYLNNLPFNLKYLECTKANCNLPPNIIYLKCRKIDIYNLPRSLQFIYIDCEYGDEDYYNDDYKYIIPKELINLNYNINKLTFLYFYQYEFENTKKLKSIY